MFGVNHDPISLLLNWRETSSNSIVAELLHARIHTTREAKSRKQLVASLADRIRRRLTNDVSIDFIFAVGFVFDQIPLPYEEKEQILGE
jgi:hypothetical protein